MSVLLDYLQKLRDRDNRGALADLRCALMPSRRHRAWPILAPFGGIGEGHHAKVVQTIAGLFAYHSLILENGNLGDTCRDLMTGEEKADYLQERKTGPMTRRFQYLLASSREEICDRAARVVLYAKAKEIGVNYGRLETDLIYWAENVKARWAKSFWLAEEKEGL